LRRNRQRPPQRNWRGYAKPGDLETAKSRFLLHGY
jgi:hypothetical protein